MPPAAAPRSTFDGSSLKIAVTPGNDRRPQAIREAVAVVARYLQIETRQRAQIRLTAGLLVWRRHLRNLWLRDRFT
jgi:hypothetical protein